MKLATIALASAFALSSTFALAATSHHHKYKSGARTHQGTVGMSSSHNHQGTVGMSSSRSGRQGGGSAGGTDSGANKP
jgi:hypothetical protein